MRADAAVSISANSTMQQQRCARCCEIKINTSILMLSLRICYCCGSLAAMLRILFPATYKIAYIHLCLTHLDSDNHVQDLVVGAGLGLQLPHGAVDVGAVQRKVHQREKHGQGDEADLGGADAAVVDAGPAIYASRRQEAGTCAMTEHIFDALMTQHLLCQVQPEIGASIVTFTMLTTWMMTKSALI